MSSGVHHDAALLNGLPLMRCFVESATQLEAFRNRVSKSSLTSQFKSKEPMRFNMGRRETGLMYAGVMEGCTLPYGPISQGPRYRGL
jgi:hypothetical protein